jgi:transcriptional regulator with XRE-family HTH domain
MRHQAGMTQAGLAAVLGVAQNTLSSWEAGRYRPAAGVLARVAAVAQAAEAPRAA